MCQSSLENRPPSYVQCIYNISQLEDHRDQIDINLSLYLILFGYWNPIWEYRQLQSAMNSQPTSGLHWNLSYTASSSIQEFRLVLEQFQATLSSWNRPVPAEVQMFGELFHMNFHVSFEELQVLAGMQGEQEARRAVPLLKQWYGSSQSRQAIWHAGQILRAATTKSPPVSTGHYTPTHRRFMRDFHTVCLYHAGLTLWVYGLMSRASAREKEQTNELMSRISYHPPALPSEQPRQSPHRRSVSFAETSQGCGEDPIIYLDCDPEYNVAERHKFIKQNIGKPAIQAILVDAAMARLAVQPGSLTKERLGQEEAFVMEERGETLSSTAEAGRVPHSPPSASANGQTVFLHNPGAVMDVAIEVMKRVCAFPSGGARSPPQSRPPVLVENITRLMRDLGRAAEEVGK